MGPSRSSLVHPLAPPTSFFQRLKKVPLLMVLIVLVLWMICVLALYSAACGSWSPWAGKHMIRVGIGLVLMVGIAVVPIWSYRKLAPLGWVLALIVLGMLEFIGGGQGVQRWLSIGGFNLQPSEPAKLAVILFLAAYFHSMNPELIRNLRTYVPAAVIASAPFAQVLMQPDLGTSVMLLGSAAAVIFVAGMPKWMIGSIFGAAVAAVPVLWASLYDYQKSRILVFLNPGADQLGAGYQITQSKIALGSGGLFGKGYLQGSQARLNYLPEKQTDFVFTMIGEEFGYFGCLFIIGLYVILVALLLRLGLQLQYRFSRLMVVGIATMLFLYVFVNVAMVTGLIPVVGAPLPLISYGGTALMTVFIAMGLVISAVIYDQESAD
ncbi:MAG: rod shape-determining protein RodA [Alphaproteobacteria bacterium]|nr:rod shape-determining protein RodA [Alphaproteobacteria bacterium]